MKRLVLTLLVLGAFTLPASAQKDITAEGQVKIGVHKFKLDNDSLYQIEVRGKEFVPNVNLLGYYIPNTIPFGKDQNAFRGLFFPPKKGEYTATVLPNISFNPPQGLLDYTITLKAMKLDETPILKKDEKLTANDPKYSNQQAFGDKSHHKAYPVKMKAGQIYIIDMIAKKADGNVIDPYLFLENAKKNILARDDDGGGFPNARIMHRATEDGEYTIIATGLSDRSNLGDYTIMVRSVKEEK